ncbi:MAG TPA: hypothetical protein VKV69_02900 [Actinomycetota bacterium]|nr:hypothetical protein [Actinomycetota bacterium]
MRRGVILGLALIALSLALQSAGPVTFASSKKTRSLIAGAHLTRTLVFDNGSLRLTPAHEDPLISEAHALELWQSRGGGYQVVAGVDVFFARATVRGLPKRVQTDAQAPHFEDRPAWVIMWVFAGPTECGRLSAAPSHATRIIPAPTLIELIAADGSDEGVTYQSFGAACGGTSGPFASAATYQISAPWKIVSAATQRCPVVGHPCVDHNFVDLIVTIPRCAHIAGGEAGGGRNEASNLFVFAEVPMTGPCAGTKQVTDSSPIIGSPVPPTLGLLQGFETGIGVLQYFDGALHTQRVKPL